MIPPCDPSILDKNQQFKKLHQHLTTNLLNPDASTRADGDIPERKAIAEELKNLQIKHAKRKIIKQTLWRACLEDPVDSRNDALSSTIRETGAVIAMFLGAPSGLNEYESGSLVNDQREASLLKSDIETFHDKTIQVLIPLLSETLSSWLNSLRSIADMGNQSSTTTASSSNIPTIAANQSRSRIISRLSISKRIQTPRLSPQVEERIARIHQIQMLELPCSRNKVAVTAANLLATRGEAMERMIVLLERTKHGSLSRATKARADYLATVAECMNNKAQVTKLETLSTIYTPENTAALENYSAHLRETITQLEETQNIANQTLQEYDQVGTSTKRRGNTGPMTDIARRYGDLAQEVEAVQREIKKLEI
ncbi:conserved hypothetical protein [Talaromyces stipitatus ATCC 10500]|uniref:Uncharacterized protein n=1 Tax=Talaromyces stipitatus (strain ATCC 10500 / CBS 375.48 / QM 6759 / NRRL 1006) TaxID=441959 RepID=B8LWR0_TALSN|nr:uncharacterized protein TSTA_078200 [Talaromyces stipitatus ATCC 10500]EED24457.1 conserved hypothetical protein [Talaromyces stipitatus ATCC 10500]